MNSREFSKKCQPLNQQYAGLFGCIPSPRDFAASWGDYYDALSKAVETQTPIEELLPKAEIPLGSNVKI